MLHGRRVLLAMKVCYLIYLQTDSSSNRTTAQATQRQIVAAVFERLEDYNRIIVHGAREGKTATASDQESRAVIDAHTPYSLGTMLNTNTDEAYLTSNRSGKKGSSSQQFSSAHHKDAFLIIRSLCMLTMKPVSSTPIVNTQITPSSRIRRSSSASIQEKVNAVSSTDTNPVVSESILQSKILGLELLLEVFTRTGTAALLSKIPALIFAVKHFLCYSLLSNCTSSDNTVVSLSLKIFVPLIQNCRHHLKTEIEAFVTQVFFVLLDSKNTLVDNKRRVVQLFEEICGDPHTLAEIFLNYDCDLSAVDLFQRIVNCLAKVAKYGLDERDMSSGSRGEKIRQDQRMLRLEGMKAMKEILASLNASLISSMRYKNAENPASSEEEPPTTLDVSSSTSLNKGDVSSASSADVTTAAEKQSFVQIYDSKKKRKEEEAKVILRFNQKPTAGIKYASQVGLVNGDDPSDIASFLIANNDVLEKTQIGEYLGRDPDIQDGFPLKVLHQYVTKLDFTGLSFDEAIRFYLSGFRLPGEAQKVRIYILISSTNIAFYYFHLPTVDFENH
jgi:brefeldin A-inhibited guanine nucleotide-exchange protein